MVFTTLFFLSQVMRISQLVVYLLLDMPSRSREFEPFEYDYVYIDNNVVTAQSPVSVPSGTESIVWVSGNFVNHSRVKRSWTPINYSDRTNGAKHSSVYLPTELRNGVGSKSVSFKIPSWLDIEQKITNPVRNNLAVDLLEAAELKGLAKSTLDKLLKLTTRPLDLLFKKDLDPRGKLRTVPKGRKEVEDAYLEAQFGYIPLVSTIKKLNESARRYNSVADKIKGRAGSWTSVRFKRDGKFSDVMSYSYGGTDYKAEAKWTQVKRFTCKAKWSYPVHLPRVRLLTDYLGLNVSPDDFWNIIPLSFVIDWVVDIGQVLENLSSGTLSESLDIKDSYYSVKTEWECRYTAKDGANYWLKPSSYEEICKEVGKTYSRNLTIPPYRDWDILNPSLTPGKALSGAALAGQKSRKRR